MSTKGNIVKKGIERLARIYCWPNEPIIAEKDKYEFDALCEFVVFNEFVKKPFFSILHEALTDRVANLYLHLLPSVNEDAPMLTLKEAFLFFRLIGKKKTRSILDVISCPPSTYNGIIESIDKLEYELFVMSFENYDNRQMFQVLWQMRYILYGVSDAWEYSEPTERISTERFNEWTKSSYNYQSFFCEIPDEDVFIKEKVLDIVNPDGSSHRRIRRSPIYITDEEILEEFKNYLESCSSLFNSEWKKVIAEFKNEPDHTLTGLAGCDMMAKLILTHNVILHKDDIMKRYGIDSSEIYEEYINGDVYVYDGEKDILRYYISSYTHEMLYIYNKVKDILEKDVNDIIKSLKFIRDYAKTTYPMAASPNLTSNDDAKEEEIGDYFKLPEDFFTNTVYMELNLSCPNHRHLKDTITKIAPAKLVIIVNWLVARGFVNDSMEDKKNLVLAISGLCADKSLVFKPVKLKSSQAADNISVLIQQWCVKPSYAKLSELFDIPNYSWRALDTKHCTELRGLLEKCSV